MDVLLPGVVWVDHRVLFPEISIALPLLCARQVESEYEAAERSRLRKVAAREESQPSAGQSASLADRLLQGWVMLSRGCPSSGCHNPLMRDPRGLVSCVSCGPVTTREGTEPPLPGATKAVDMLGHVGQQEDKEDAEASSRHSDPGEKHLYANHRTAGCAGSVEAPDSTPIVAVNSPGTISTLDRRRIKGKVLDSLFRALEVSQERLDSCTRASFVDVQESGQQADLITKLAQAARALADVPI